MINEELNLDTAWAITEPTFSLIVERLSGIQPSRLVEFGSGPSSIRFSMSFPQAEIVSIESDFKFYNQTLSLKDKYACSNLTIIHLPIVLYFFAFRLFRTYGPLPRLKNIDCLFIDGPPYFIPGGREACLYRVYDSLRIGGIVILDDYNRTAEKEAVKNWMHTYPDSFAFEEYSLSHGLAILTKIKQVKPRIVCNMKTLASSARVLKKALKDMKNG
jgi:precorrin-6B methylase 2